MPQGRCPAGRSPLSRSGRGARGAAGSGPGPGARHLPGRSQLCLQPGSGLLLSQLRLPDTAPAAPTARALDKQTAPAGRCPSLTSKYSGFGRPARVGSSTAEAQRAAGSGGLAVERGPGLAGGQGPTHRKPSPEHSPTPEKLSSVPPGRLEEPSTAQPPWGRGPDSWSVCNLRDREGRHSWPRGAGEAPESMLLLCRCCTPAPGPPTGGCPCTPREAQAPGQRRVGSPRAQTAAAGHPSPMDGHHPGGRRPTAALRLGVDAATCTCPGQRPSEPRSPAPREI